MVGSKSNWVMLSKWCTNPGPMHQREYEAPPSTVADIEAKGSGAMGEILIVWSN